MGFHGCLQRVREVCFCSQLVEYFYQEGGVKFLSDAFSAFIEMIMCILSFVLLKQH